MAEFASTSVGVDDYRDDGETGFRSRQHLDQLAALEHADDDTPSPGKRSLAALYSFDMDQINLVPRENGADENLFVATKIRLVRGGGEGARPPRSL
jgi:hypothetical protein